MQYTSNLYGQCNSVKGINNFTDKSGVLYKRVQRWQEIKGKHVQRETSGLKKVY